MAKKFRRSSANKKLAGVCSGIAKYFDLDANLIRVIYIVLALCTAAFPGLLIYILIAFLVDEE